MCFHIGCEIMTSAGHLGTKQSTSLVIGRKEKEKKASATWRQHQSWVN